MQFNSIQAFLQMGGYGFYVWLSFGVSLLAMVALVLESVMAKKQIRKQVQAQQARAQRIKQSKLQQQQTNVTEVQEQ